MPDAYNNMVCISEFKYSNGFVFAADKVSAFNALYQCISLLECFSLRHITHQTGSRTNKFQIFVYSLRTRTLSVTCVTFLELYAF